MGRVGNSIDVKISKKLAEFTGLKKGEEVRIYPGSLAENIKCFFNNSFFSWLHFDLLLFIKFYRSAIMNILK